MSLLKQKAQVNTVSNEYVLKISNLKVTFKNKKKQINIIRGVDIKLRQGDIVGIVGESGSGKSVTTKSLLNVNGSAALTSCDSFQLFDKEYTSYEGVNWKHIRGGEVAYIPQNPMTSMNPSRKIGKQIFDVLEVYRKEMKTKEEKTAYAIEILKRFKIVNPEGTLAAYPHELSGGMKQRIIIAMGIMAGAKIIIADEPTTALDTTVQASVLELLQEVNKEFNVSIIFISHNIAVVAKLCTYIYVMYAGRVVEKAPTKELFTNPKHPYTWALIASIPEDKDKNEKLYTIPGTPPNMAALPAGDPFAPRNEFAVAIDFKQEPPLFEVSEGHWAATWTLHPMYGKVNIPAAVAKRLESIRKAFK